VTDTQVAPVRRAPILLCLVLICAYPLLSRPLHIAIQNLAAGSERAAARIATEIGVWLYAAIVLGIALLWERRTLASIGLRRPTFASLGFGIGAVVTIYSAGGVVVYVVYHGLHQTPHVVGQIRTLVGGSVVYALCLAVRAGVIEEVLFRGLAIEQLSALTGIRWLAALIATVFFVLMHGLYFDWVQLLPVAAIGIVLTLLYLWRHDLWANIIAHTIIDGTSLTLAALHLHVTAP
jgi:membrane protease YdiL (CAAX protease family)